VLQGPKHRLAGTYLPGLPAIERMQHVLIALLNRLAPKLADHLRALGAHPLMYAAQWMLTVFTYTFPFPIGEVGKCERMCECA
jgi:TBC1 domain family member 10